MKMFKTLVAIGVLCSAGSAFGAEQTHLLRVNVPFAFVVEGEQFAAGNYDVSQTESGIVTVQGQGKAVMLLSTPKEAARSGEVSGLRFTNSASHSYLSAVSVEGEGTRAVPVHLTHAQTLAH